MVLVSQLYETPVYSSHIDSWIYLIIRQSHRQILCIWPISSLCFITPVESPLYVSNIL